MRIVGEIAHPILKITIFKNEGKFSVKFESNLLEQTYKFRDDDRLQTVEEVKNIIDPTFVAQVEQLLRGMNEARFQAFVRNLPLSDDEGFEEII